MRKPLTLFVSILIIVLFTASASAEWLLNDLREESPTEAAPPSLSLVGREDGSLIFSFRIEALNLEQVATDEGLFQAITLPGGGIRGAIGHPGLPTFGKLIAIPEGAEAQVRVRAKEETVLTEMRLLPVQPEGAVSLVMDPVAYSSPTPDAEPDAELADPGMIRGLEVAALQVNPLRYDPQSGELTVTHSMEIEIRFEGSDRQAAAEFIPESFHKLYRESVLGYEESGYYREGETEVGPGSHLYIYSSAYNVVGNLAPLLDWRRRQGYAVVAVDENEAGGSNYYIEDYIDAFYASADPPLEFVTLVGDANGSVSVPCFYENLSGYGGEGDHRYSTIVGDDILADVHIGRLSVTSTSQLLAVVNKIVNYETAPPMSDTGWFSRAGLTGDPSSSGITTIYVNQWLKEELLEQGYSQVDTIWGGNFLGQMTSSINSGLSIFGYRGYWFMSGMGSENIMSLGNGGELPFAIIVTCDTGSFADDSNCRSEAFLRAPNGGGVASVGTATTGTHTRYNNCYYMGAWHGLLNGDDFRVGSAHTRGKLELYHNYQLSEPNKVEIWSTWNNLMGDPVTQIWTALPTELEVDYPSMIPAEAVSLPVTVTRYDNPLEGARVAAYKEGEVRAVAYTGADGFANLPLSGLSDGTLLVTVEKHNHIPHRGSMTVGDPAIYPVLENVQVDDDLAGDSQGNNNGRVNPDENIELLLSLRNIGSNPVTNVSATLSGGDYVTILDGEEDYGDLAPGVEVWCAEDFDIHVAPDAPDGEIIEMSLVASTEFVSWTSRVALEVHSAAFSYQDFTWGDGATLDPGESGDLSLRIENDGSTLATQVTTLLETSSPWIVIHDPSATFGSVNVGASAENLDDAFSLSIDPECYEGHQANFTLTLDFNNGAVDRIDFAIPVGQADTNDPTGPDGHGYLAFGNNDSGYDQAPVFDWVEIDPSYGGSGTNLNLTDFGWEQDDTETLDLPFEFKYYGQVFDKISICSNGWVVLGETSLVLYRNWNLPAAGSASNLIAAFWDNLYLNASSKVLTWYDEEEDRFVIEWSRLKNNYGNYTETFELILYDPAAHPTSTGDGMFLMQYDTISNVDGTNGYATVGIQNEARDDGLTYTYWNQYPSSAATVTAGRAILFTPSKAVPRPSPSVDPDHFTEIAPPGETIDRMMSVGNVGEAGTLLDYSIEVVETREADEEPGDGARLAWLHLSSSSGQLAVGETDEIQVTLNSQLLIEGIYRAEIVVVHNGGASVIVPVTFVVNESGTGTEELPARVFLARNHPNPFNPKTEIRFGLPEASEARLAVYDSAGRLVRTLAEGRIEAGVHVFSWDGRDEAGEQMSSGIYFATLRAGEVDLNQKMVLLK